MQLYQLDNVNHHRQCNKTADGVRQPQTRTDDDCVNSDTPRDALKLVHDGRHGNVNNRGISFRPCRLSGIRRFRRRLIEFG